MKTANVINKDDKSKSKTKTRKLHLWTHQKKTVRLMRNKEFSLIHDPDDINKINIGLICDDTGTGKTISILKHIKDNPTLVRCYEKRIYKLTSLPICLVYIIIEYLDCRNNSSIFENYSYCNDKFFYKHSELFSPDFDDSKDKKYKRGKKRKSESKALINDNKDNKDNNDNKEKYIDKKKNARDADGIRLLSCSLIVVSHTIYKQWIKEINEINNNFSKKRSSPLTYYPMIGKRNIMDVEEFDKHNIVICKARKYKDLADYSNSLKLRWQRVIFDEAPVIPIPACSSIDSLFYWGITATYSDLKNMKNYGLLRRLFSHLSYDDILKIMIRIDNKDIDPRCFDFPPYILYNIVCKCPLQYKILTDCYPNTALSNFINEELYDDAKDYLVNLVVNNGGAFPFARDYIDRTEGDKIKSKFDSNFDFDSDNSDNEDESKIPRRRGRPPTKTSKMGKRARKEKNIPKEIQLLSILELQLLNLNLNRKLSQLVREQRTLFLLKEIYNAEICFRCHKSISLSPLSLSDNKSISSTTDNKSTLSSIITDNKSTSSSIITDKKNCIKSTTTSLRSDCCELNYCFECIPFVLACPICPTYTQKLKTPENFILNENKDDVKGLNGINKRMRRITVAQQLRSQPSETKFHGINSISTLFNNFANLVFGSNNDNNDNEYDKDAKDNKDESSEDEDEPGGIISKKRKFKGDNKNKKRDEDIFPEIKANAVLKKTKKIKQSEELDNVVIDTIISNYTEEHYSSIKPGELDKMEACLQIIKENPNSRLGVFINDPKMGNILESNLIKEDISTTCLKGTSDHLRNVIKNFTDGLIDALIMNSSHTGSGLNLHMGDGIIIYNAKNHQAVSQAIARFQRHGRSKTNRLKVWRLRFE